MSSGYMTLLGAEQVVTAANRMTSAADEMRNAASSIDGSVEQFRLTWYSVEEQLRETRESIDALRTTLEELLIEARKSQ